MNGTTQDRPDQEPRANQPGIRHARDSTGERADDGLAQHLSELARELQAEPDMPALLEHIVAATVHEIDGADHGGISLIDGRTVRAVAATDEVVNLLDRTQEELGEGPCLSSLREEITVRSDDLATEQRWPRFAAAATGEGVGSMLSVQLFVEGDNLGALNLYAMSSKAFDRHDESVAMALAAHAAVAMKGNRVETNLRTALASRDVIGQGKGILMERFKISSDEAFRLLVLASQHAHVKLRDIAEELAATGELRMD
jgi:transcriptional regulator with GAF, ATPase, and Fis domain